MSRKERGFLTVILVSITLMVTVDLTTDSGEGVPWWHLLSEALLAVAALIGIFLLVRNSMRLKKTLAVERALTTEARVDAERWKAQSKKYLDGLSRAIDDQLSSWNLTSSEKEVAFLLLKGLSLKDIAEVRKTTEKTARAQSVAVYSKSGLAGRSELAAFFLEDLLLPQEPS